MRTPPAVSLVAYNSHSFAVELIQTPHGLELLLQFKNSAQMRPLIVTYVQYIYNDSINPSLVNILAK
jgi:hypothetical protein